MEPTKETKSSGDQQRIYLLSPCKHFQVPQLHLAALTTAKSSDNPSTTCERYTQLLHEYNDIKDVGQGLMGLIADARGVRQIEVEKELGVSEED
ncbi:hypothetical protein N7537_005168 [Penicillium hordei]|uniref:Swi5-domain-containing protein n=1 Tax=Penicillium hordei TaxID=40994 RepID=A0AAD6H4J0_9EURO|nr:uncharacterized protein N7537_005168 [Penicillium hordei]KAJ5608549.1 hypothetical protein N7537_005168 [Penicillium hordei]